MSTSFVNLYQLRFKQEINARGVLIKKFANISIFRYYLPNIADNDWRFNVFVQYYTKKVFKNKSLNHTSYMYSYCNLLYNATVKI